MKFEGTVLSHDVDCHCVALKVPEIVTGILILQDNYATFDSDYDKIAGLAVGSKVRGTYKTVDYINYALEFHTGNLP